MKIEKAFENIDKNCVIFTAVQQKIGEQNEKKLTSNPSCYSSWCL